MTTKQFTERIGDLIGKNDLKTAITELKQLLQKSNKLNDIILQSARYNDVMQQIHLGTINFEDANITKNKIRYALLDMLREIEEGIENNPELEKETDRILTGSQLRVNNVKADKDVNFEAKMKNSTGEIKDVGSEEGNINFNIDLS